MTSTSQQQVIERNEMALREILRTLERGQGSFTVIFARANYQGVREDMAAALRSRSPLPLHQVTLPRETTTIYQVMRRAWEEAVCTAKSQGKPVPGTVLVEGFENLNDVRGAIATANLMRDEFLRTFKCPLVFWVNDETLKLFLRQGKDFASYATTKRFEIDPQALIESLEKTVGHAFEHVMATGAGRFWTVEPGQYRELSAGRSEVTAAGMELDPALDASIEFFLAQDPVLDAETARAKYEHCLGLWEQVEAPEREGCTWFYLNLWWREFAARNRSQYDVAYEEARRCCERSLVCFEDAKRLDLVSRFINGLEAVLYRMAAREGEESALWDQLQEVADRGFSLHEAEENRLRQSYDLGSMAMVALGRKQWAIAYEKSRAALELYLGATGRPHRGQRRPWPEFNPQLYEYHEALMRYLVGRSLSGLGRISDAIDALEKARQVGKADYEPELYIDLLKSLSLLHFTQGDYRRAYELKQDYRATEAEYGFRPFTGARSLRPIRRAANPAWHHSDITVVEQGMRRNLAAGRENDVTALVSRISLPQYRLIVVHGESGVGKSSLMRAGLVPRLRSSSMDAKSFVPVLLRRYGNWARDLGVQLCRELNRIDPTLTVPVPVTAADILELLRKNSDRNTVTVLVFDQFEEFFFNNVTTPEGVGVREKSFQENRKHLYDFIAKCLEIIDVKVVLSLREDYLHYLLELDRVSPLVAIDRDILRRDVRYPLDDFSPARAKQVIANLTGRSQFNLSPELIDRLVEDLATDFGEVRPIELQVVGAQLQTDNISELEAYQELGPDPK
ncbi:MAG: ATP-binding protein, partial [Cyanobacteria bacterium P01_D01_bin.73]